MPFCDRRMPAPVNSQVNSGEHKQMKFLLQNKVPTESKVDFLLVHRTRYMGTKIEVRSFKTTLIRQC